MTENDIALIRDSFAHLHRRKAETAQLFYDRLFEIAPEVREKIAERLWTGASLIISDLPLSGETNNVGTDLTVKLH